MISKHTRAKIQRLFFRDNLSIHGIARKMSLSRSTVKKWLHVPIDTEIKFYRTPPEKLIKPFESWLLQALKTDSPQPKRDRRTAMALFEEIQKQGFTGSYSRVTEYVNNWREHSEGVVAKSTPSEDMQHWMMWLYFLEQPHRSHKCYETSVNINRLYDVLTPSPNSPRTKALVVLAKLEGFSVSQIARYLAIARPTVRGYLSDFLLGGDEELFKGKTRARKSQNYSGPIRQDRNQSSLSWPVRPSHNCMALPHSC